MLDTPKVPYDCNPVKSIKPVESGKNLYEKRQIARFDFVAPNPKFSASKAKELGRYGPKRFVRPVTVKVWETARTVYATVWANDKACTFNMSGTGTAGGGGYHMQSAAISDAFVNAGVDMAYFGGYGDSAVLVAIEALAKKLGYRVGEVMES